ncbi:hypothetical protein GCM10009760_56420 [Kitasatospora kazusensis]|uniref:ATP-grasp domain-containing protein n=1 Tax=Kitasatospora kazusensis TaxID=407974 RepID=A0ABP5LXK1_9ACTN
MRAARMFVRTWRILTKLRTDPARATSLPTAAAVDIGLSQDPDTGVDRWAVVEANMPWLAHSYAADPEAVLDVVLRAAGPLHLVAPGDRGFLRGLPAPAGSCGARDRAAAVRATRAARP